MKRSYILVCIVLLVLILDQVLKFYIKTNFSYGSGFAIMGQDWARIHFVENEGMAFGLTFGDKCIGVRNGDQCSGIHITPESGKLILSSFRILMVAFLFYIIYQLFKARESMGLLISFSLIFAGALGNIIDSALYGLIFSESTYHGNVAQLFPQEGGYASFLHGKVVDMFYFPMVDTILPDWIPLVGGQRFEFFKPVFNIADASITTGVASILLFHRNFLKKDGPANKSSDAPVSPPEKE